jgi:uncharacterized membrane protein YkoI
MFPTSRKTIVALGAIGAIAAGGTSLAAAATSSTSSSADPASSQQRPERPAPVPLTGDTADKVRAAALAKVPGATVLRVEEGGPDGAAYHAHVRKADGTEVEVQVNSDYTVAAVNTMGGHP